MLLLVLGHIGSVWVVDDKHDCVVWKGEIMSFWARLWRQRGSNPAQELHDEEYVSSSEESSGMSTPHGNSHGRAPQRLFDAASSNSSSANSEDGLLETQSTSLPSTTSSSSTSSAFSSFLRLLRRAPSSSTLDSASSSDSETSTSTPQGPFFSKPPCIFIENPDGQVTASGWTVEFEEVVDKLSEERQAANSTNEDSGTHFWNSEFYTEQELQLEVNILDRRRRLLLFMIAIDLCYCTIWLALQRQLGDGRETTARVQEIYFILCIIIDMVGTVGVVYNYLFLVTAFVLAEGAALGFSTIAPLSPFIFFHLAILLLSLQIRIGLVKKQRLEQELAERRANILQQQLEAAALAAGGTTTTTTPHITIALPAGAASPPTAVANV